MKENGGQLVGDGKRDSMPDKLIRQSVGRVDRQRRSAASPKTDSDSRQGSSIDSNA